MSVQRDTAPSTSGQNRLPIDETNLRILDILRDNGRISMAALADRLHISRANVYSRVEALIADGIIEGFTALVDSNRVGLPISALVFVTVHPQSWHHFRESILQMPDVEYCVITTGEHDAMLVIREADMGGVHDFVTSVVSARPEVKAVVSVVVLDEVVKRPYLLPSDIPDRSGESSRLGMTRFTRAAEGRSDMARGALPR